MADIFGTDGNDDLTGTSGDDHIYGGAGDDQLFGGDGDDVLDGGTDIDYMAGGAGNDTYYVDEFNGYEDYEVYEIAYERPDEGIDTVVVDFAAATPLFYNLPDNIENLTVVGVALVHGNALDNVITGDDGAQNIYGGGGTDTLVGRGGNDTYHLGDSTGSVVVEAADEGIDRVYVDGSYEVPLNVEFLYVGVNGFGTEQANGIYGSAGSNLLVGAGGDDRLHGDAGDDTLIGGAGKDVLFGGEGFDTADFSGSDHAITNLGRIFDGDTLYEMEKLVGSSFDDTLDLSRTDTGLTTVVGGAGNDVIKGGAGNELLQGNSGNDLLAGGDGDDLLRGYGGDDRLAGDGGNDRLEGSTGNDVLLGDAGDDRLIGGDGIDTADYATGGTAVSINLSVSTAQDTGLGMDRLSGFENVTGGTGDDRLVGSIGANVMHGGAGNDILRGLGDGDTIDGEAGNDNIAGGAGDDRLTGGVGKDLLQGGVDADSFVFTSIADSVVGAGRDTIDDFQQGADRVDLSAIDADMSAAGDQAFSFIGSAAFSHAAGQLRQGSDGAGNTVIEGDVQGDGVADFQILLKGAYTLNGSDFTL